MTNAITLQQPAALVSQADSDETAITLWLGRLKLAETTREAYHREVDRFTGYMNKPLRQVGLSDLHAYAAHIAQPLPSGRTPSQATQQRTLAAVKSLLSFCERIGYLPFNPGAAIELRRLKDTLGERIMSEADITRLIALEDDPRNHLLLTCLYATGGRVSEVCALQWRDVQWADDNTVFVTLFGKRNKTRVVKLKPHHGKALKQSRGSAALSDPVFVSRQGKAIHRSQVWRIVKAAAQRAGIEASPSPHWFRHAHITHALERGAPANLVQATVGHASLDTTTRYSHVRPGQSSGDYLAI